MVSQLPRRIPQNIIWLFPPMPQSVYCPYAWMRTGRQSRNVPKYANRKSTFFCRNGWQEKQVAQTEERTAPRLCTCSNVIQHLHQWPAGENIRRFIYADDLSLPTQADCFETIETRLTSALRKLTGYYKQNSLNANPGKTQVCAFHLKNHLARRKLNIE